MRQTFRILFFFFIFSHSLYALKDTHGHTFQTTDFKGKWVILNYWAEWCDNCIQEIPELNRFYHDNRDKNILIYGVNYDQLSATELKQAILKTHIIFPVLLDDPSDIWKLDRISLLPVTYIINPDGKVVEKILGPNTKKSLLQHLYAVKK